MCRLSCCTAKLTKIKMFPGLRLPQILPHLTDPTRTCRDGPRLTALPLPNVALRSSTVPEPSFDTLKSAQKQKNAHFQKSATIAQKVLIWLFHFVGHPHMFKQPDPQAFLQHTLTQSHYSWDHATWGSPQPTSFAAAASKSSNSLKIKFF